MPALAAIMIYFTAIFGRPATPASCHGLIVCILIGRRAGL
jgi:hypothetical protein